MRRLLLKLAIAATVGSLLSSSLVIAQVLPPAKKPARVEIVEGPSLEIARDDMAIIRWTTDNPGGSDDRFAVVYYGTDPANLKLTAKSHIRLNRGHLLTVFRVRMVDLKPRTTYYYKVTSTESNGKGDGVESGVKKFTTPGPGERVLGQPPPTTAAR
jgi:hypothetical protein